MKNYEYNKEYAKKYNELNTKTITIRLNNEQYDKLQEYCRINNIPRATLIKDRIKDIID